VLEIQAKEAELATIGVAWIKRKAAEIAGVDIPEDEVRASDKIAALNLLAKMTPDALVPNKSEVTGSDGTALVIEIVRFADPDKDSSST
jgi:hypothetical protein